MITLDFSKESLYVDWVGEVTQALYDPNIRYIFLKGGAGAGKSYLITQLLIQNIIGGCRVGVFRKVSRTLKASCLQLFKDVTRNFKLQGYVECKENKTVTGGSGLGMMFGLDDPEKIKSLAQFDWFRIEETTELTYDDFTQLDLRLRGADNHKVICTFNPISDRHWLKKEVEDHPKLWGNAVRISKTARDNKFIDEQYLKSLDDLKIKNPAKYRVYAQNLRGQKTKGSIFPEYHIFDYDIEPDYIGLDFGFNDPNALTYLKEEDQEGEAKKRLYIQEKIYLSGQTSTDLVDEMERLEVSKDKLIIADGARPEMIRDISKAGFRIENVKKYKGSKNDQIDAVKTYTIYINGPNILKEVSGYEWRLDKNGNPIDIPVDGDDHLIDSLLYGATGFKVTEPGIFFI